MSRRGPVARIPSATKARRRNFFFRRGLLEDESVPPLPFRLSVKEPATNPPHYGVSPGRDYTREKTSHRTDDSGPQRRFRPSDVGFVRGLILFEMAPYSPVWVCPPPF